MTEKRIRERRAGFDSGQTFPFQEMATGRIISSDRRRTPDRRLSNIWMELITLTHGRIPADWGKQAARRMGLARAR